MTTDSTKAAIAQYGRWYGISTVVVVLKAVKIFYIHTSFWYVSDSVQNSEPSDKLWTTFINVH